jgi:hypothetical protein
MALWSLESAARRGDHHWFVTPSGELVGCPDHGVHDTVDGREKRLCNEGYPHTFTVRLPIEQQASVTRRVGELSAADQVCRGWRSQAGCRIRVGAPTKTSSGYPSQEELTRRRLV